MAATSSSVSPATTVLSAVVSPTRSPSQRRAKVSYVSGLNSFGGLKATNDVAALGLPVCTDRSFAEIVGSLKNKKRGGGGGGALTSTCNAAIAEIFKIAAIMPGLVMVGVAVGFVLLRIEATVEESE